MGWSCGNSRKSSHPEIEHEFEHEMDDDEVCKCSWGKRRRARRCHMEFTDESYGDVRATQCGVYVVDEARVAGRFTPD